MLAAARGACVNNELRSLTLLSILLTPGLVDADDTAHEPERPLAADIVTEHLETTYRFENDGTGTSVQEARARVVTPIGREMISQLEVQYDTSTSNTRFDYLRTIKPDGRVVEARTADAHDVALAPNNGFAQTLSDIKVKVLTTPDVDIGDRVEWRITTTIDRPDPRGEFWAIHDASAAFTDSEGVALDIPAERPVALRASQDGHSVVTHAGRTIHRWTISHSGPADDDEENARAVFAVSTFETWDRFGAWFRGLLTAASASTPEIEALAHRLIAGKETPRARAEAIYDYVARSVRYVALMFGGHGYRPHAITDVLKNSYGDCKDQFALLSALLRAAGVAVDPVLVEVGRDLREPDVPLPSAFNHVIAAATLEGELVYLDTTAPAAAFGVLMPPLRGNDGLLIREEQVRIVTVIANSPLPQFVHARVAGSVSGTGALEATSHLEVRGDFELVYRGLFHRTNEDVARGFTQVMADEQVSGAKAANATPSDPANLAGPFVLDYQVSKELYVNPLDGEADVSIPWMLRGVALSALANPSSDSSADNDSTSDEASKGFSPPSELTETIELALPPNYRLSLPLPVRVANDAASYTSEYKADGGRLIATRSLRLRPEASEAARRAGFPSLRKIVERDQGQTLHITRTSKPLASDQLDPLTADQLSSIGYAALTDKKFEAALPVLLKATEKEPRHGRAWGDLGRAHLGLKHWADAERSFKKQIEINPLDEYSHANLGFCYLGQKRYDEALASFKKQLEINPFDSAAYAGIGYVHKEQHRLPEAVQAFEQGLRANPEDPRLYVELVSTLGLMGRTQEAKVYAEKLAALQGVRLTPEQLQMLTRAPATSGTPIASPMGHRITASGKALEQLLIDAKAEARQIIAKLGSLTAADREFERVSDVARLATNLNRIGQALALKGERGAARIALKAALEISLDRDVALRLSELEDTEGNRDEALRYYAWATTGGTSPATAPPRLAQSLAKTLPDQTARRNHLSKLMFGFVEARKVRQLTWPQGLALKDTSDVVVRMLVDERGAVIGVVAVRGDGPPRDNTLAAARALKFAPLIYDGAGIRHTRTLWVRYNRTNTIEAMWGFGPDPIGECTYGLASKSRPKP
jgi:tetratricopeptide (TPR) repeat protein/transglutaminase-like putative cysteine protease